MFIILSFFIKIKFFFFWQIQTIKKVWKNSRRIGCGQAISKGRKGGTFTVCNYDPPGNWKGEELQNVSPPLNGIGIEWKPLGSNSHVELPPVSTINYSTRKANKWLGKSQLNKYYYRSPKKVQSSWNNNNKFTTYKYNYGGLNKMKKTYRQSPYTGYGYGKSPYYW